MPTVLNWLRAHRPRRAKRELPPPEPVPAPPPPPPPPPVAHPITPPRVDPATQVLLRLQYQDLLYHKRALPSLRDVEFRNHSQNGEDGILLYLFSILGTTNRLCVEMCAGDGIECNTANLIINHGWKGLMFDGSADNIAKAQKFYRNLRSGFLLQAPQVVQAWITAENANELIAKHHEFPGDIDLFSLDLDGVDYWVWKSLDVIRPRVIVAEYNQGLGARRAITVPYRADFAFDWGKPCYMGASLPALVTLGRQKGYRFIGSDHFGINAFFVREDIVPDCLPEADAAKCIFLPNPEENWGHYDWVEVY